MRVALYYPWIYLTSGAERVILELSGRSRHEWTLFTNHYAPHQTFPGFADRRVVELEKVSVARNVGAVARAGAKILGLRLPLEEFDALVVVCEGVGDLVVFRNTSRPALCICLTPLRLVFDAEYSARTMRGRGPFARLAIGVGSRLFRILDSLAWKRYRRIFCISEEARRRAAAGRLARVDQMEVLHVGLGVDADQPSRVFEPFFLIAGRIMWTKNIQLGIEAFRRLRDTNPSSAVQQFRLIIAGMVDKKSQPYLAELKTLAQDLPIEFRISPSDADLADLYRRCYGVLFTPFNEDWGIVPLEAMAFGKPVIAVNSGGPKETIVPGVNGFLEEPCAEAFGKRMAQLVEDPEEARRLGASGRTYSRRYTWDAFTERIDSAVQELGQAAAGATTGVAGKQQAGGVA